MENAVEHPDFIEPVVAPEDVKTPVQTLASDDFLAEDVEGQLNKSLGKFADKIQNMKSTKQAPVPFSEQKQETAPVEEVEEEADDTQYEGSAIPPEFVQGLYATLGFEYDPQSDVFNSPDEFYDFFKNVIEENVKASQNAVFANEEVYRINELAKRGINLREFFAPTPTYNEMNPVDLVHHYNTQVKGLSEEDSVERIKAFHESNVLMKEYEFVLKDMNKAEELKAEQKRAAMLKQAEAEEKRHIETRNAYYQHFNKYKDVFNEAVDKQTAERMFRVVYEQNQKGETRLSQALSNPDKLATIAWLEANADPNGNWNFNKILRRANDTASSKIAKQLKQTVSKPANNPTAPANKTNSSTPKSFFDDERYYNISK